MHRFVWQAERLDARDGRPAKRSVPPMVVSLALHTLVVIGLWNVLKLPLGLEQYFGARQVDRPRERLNYVTVPTPPPPSAAAPSRRTAPAVPHAPEPAPLVSPREIPTALPPVPGEPPMNRPNVPAVTGPIAGGTGPTRGVQPTFDDPRVWLPDPPLVYAPKTREQRLDSAITTSLALYLDSLAANAYLPNKFERGDWTMERGGQKYGIDKNYIRLGRFSIPTALLALLPINRMQGNPIAMERERSMATMRADIMYHAQAAMNEEQFRKAVRAIRDRKERERKAQEARPPRPIAAPGDRPPPEQR